MASSRYGSRSLVYVPIGTICNYGFNTNMDESSKSALGHVAVNIGQPPAKLVLGANRPKPGRATQRTAAASNSSFFDANKSSELRTAGWKLSFPKLRSGKGGNGLLSKEYYVTISGIKYAWSLSDDVSTRLGATLGELGLQPTSPTDNDYVFGARFPKPPRATKKLIGDDGSTTCSTFYDPSKTSLPTGFYQSKSSVTALST